jgi:hypothetical protein
MKGRMSMCFSVVFLSGLTGLASADSEEDTNRNALLTGKYQVTNHIVCVDSQDGFDAPPTLQARGFGGTVIDTDSGAIVFDGNGNATETRRGISIFPGPVSPGSFPSGTYEITCRYTYSISPDRSFTVNGSCTGTLPAGPLAGLTVDIPQVEGFGQISDRGNTFTLGNVEPVQQLLVLSQSGVETFRTLRLCGSSGIGIRVRDHR